MIGLPLLVAGGIIVGLNSCGSSSEKPTEEPPVCEEPPYYSPYYSQHKKNTILLSAVISGDFDLAYCMLEQGADPNTRDDPKFGNTVLIRVSGDFYGGNVKIVKLLLDYGADIDATSNNGNTALIAASSKIVSFSSKVNNLVAKKGLGG